MCKLFFNLLIHLSCLEMLHFWMNKKYFFVVVTTMLLLTKNEVKKIIKNFVLQTCTMCSREICFKYDSF